VKLEETAKKLIGTLKKIDIKQLDELNVVLLPDFFVDHFVTLKNFENSYEKIRDIHNQGGGNYPESSQNIIHGGNSANTALALAKLGIKPYLICKTSEFGLHLLEFFLGKNGVDLSCVKTNGKLAITTALEFGDNNSNVMIGDTGSVSDFSYELLKDHDKIIISNSNMVCVTTWNLTQQGSALAENVFKLAKKHHVKTYFDTGDPSPKKHEIQNLKDKILPDENLDIIGLNENELKYYSNSETNTRENIINTAKKLKEKIHARLDIHTAEFACSINDKTVVVPSYKKTNIKRTTGAGDAWNAGNIFGELLEFNDDERLLFANSVAYYYITNLEPVHPTVQDIIEMLGNI
jgi:sugar/nucleoside kinase (ribokinase family)